MRRKAEGAVSRHCPGLRHDKAVQGEENPRRRGGGDLCEVFPTGQQQPGEVPHRRGGGAGGAGADGLPALLRVQRD